MTANDKQRSRFGNIIESTNLNVGKRKAGLIYATEGVQC